MTAQPDALPAPLGWKVWTAVAMGGFAGTEARYLLGLLFPEPPGAFPWTTLAINAGGSFLLGWLTARWAGTRGPRQLRAGLGPGLLGSFTTFSAVSLAAVIEPALMVPYVGLSLALGVSAAAAGIIVGQRRAP